MKPLLSLALLLLLSVPADAQIFRRARRMNFGPPVQMDCRNGVCRPRAVEDVARNDQQQNQSQQASLSDNQLSDVLSRLDDLAVQQYTPPPQLPTPPAPAPIEPPAPDPRIDEQARELAEQSARIEALQQTIVELKQTVVAAQPAGDYAPDINSLKNDLRHVQSSLANFQTEQGKINADVTASLNAVLQDRTQVVTQIAEIKQQLSQPIDIDKLAAELAEQTPPAPNLLPLIYVTSQIGADCEDVTAKVESLRSQGERISIVEWNGKFTGLTPAQEANIRMQGVPAIYDFSSGQTAVGREDCLRFLAGL